MTPDKCVDQLGLRVENQITACINTCSEGSQFSNEAPGAMQNTMKWLRCTPASIGCCHSESYQASTALKNEPSKQCGQLAGRPKAPLENDGCFIHSLFFFFLLHSNSAKLDGNLPVMTDQVPGGHSVFPWNVSLEKRTVCEPRPAGRVGIAVFQLDSPHTHHYRLSVTVRPTLHN